MNEELKHQSLSRQEMGAVQIEHPFTEAARMFAANYAAVAGLLVLAIIIAWFVLGEIPSSNAIIGGFVVIVTLFFHAWYSTHLARKNNIV